MSGQIDLTIDGLAPQLGWNVKSGRVVPIAVSTLERSRQLPDVQTIGETLPGFQYPMWVAVFAPAKTAKEIIDKMSVAIHKAVNDPTAQKRFADVAVNAVGSSPAELDKLIKEQLAFNKAIIEKTKISVGE